MGHRRYKRKGKKTKKNPERKKSKGVLHLNYDSRGGLFWLIARGRRFTKPMPDTIFTPSPYVKYLLESAEVNGKPEEIEQVIDPMFNVVTHDTPGGWVTTKNRSPTNG